MKSKLLASVLTAVASGSLFAVPVDITPATANLSVDLAADATAPGWATLPDLVVQEKTNTPGKSSISGSGTLILTAPAGFEFNTNTLVTTFSGGDLTAASATVTSSTTITVSLTVSGTASHDSFTVSGIQARPVSGVTLDSGSITRTGGTATIDSPSAFGTLTEVGGVATSLSIATQPSATAQAGDPFVQQPVVELHDQFGHVSSQDNTSVVSATASSGSLLGTADITVVAGVATYTNLAASDIGTVTLTFSSGALTPVISDAIEVVEGAPRAAALFVTTQPSATADAGVAFAQQPVVSVYDQFGNPFTDDNLSVVTATRLSGAGDLQGTVTANVVNGVATFTNLSHNVAGDITIEFTSGVLSNAVSDTITVSAGAATDLVFATQPGDALVGLPFGIQPIVKTVDVFGNDAAPSDAEAILTISMVEGNGNLSGTTLQNIGTDGGNGLITFADLSIDSASPITRLAITVAGLNAATSEVFTVSSVIPTQIAIETQPSTNATAGELLAPQPVVRLVDAEGNLAVEDNSTIVTVTASSGALQGTVQATALGGVVSFGDLVLTTAGTTTLNFSAFGLTGASSDLIEVAPAAATTLVFTTSPAVARTDAAFGVQPVVITTDDFGNASTVGLAANQIVTVALTSGTGSLLGTTTADIGTDAGNGTVAFADLQVDAAGTGKQLTASADSLNSGTSDTFFVGGVAPADALVSVDTAVSGSVALNGPVYYEGASGDVGVGTIVLNAPAGFEFDTTSTPRVQIHRLAGPNTGGINGINTGSPVNVDSVTPTQITYTITSSSTDGTVNSITWSQIRVRATSEFSTSGDITKTGTAVLPTVIDGVTSFGHLETVAGAFAQLAIEVQPSATADAGVPFAQQPVIRLVDQFGNTATNDSSTLVTAVANGASTLQGTTTVMATNGLVTFTNLAYNGAGIITITFSSGAASVTSTEIDLGAGPVAALVFTVQPANAVVGLPFEVSPVVQTVDAFGNPSTLGLPENLDVTIALTTGPGPLTGTTTLNIGTAAGNGTVTFSDLQVGSAAEVNQLTASATDLTNAVSAVFVSVAADHLELVDGDGQTAVAGTAVAINPTVRVVDNLNNPVAGAVVTFAVLTGGGSVSEASVITDTNGLASTIYTLGGVLGDSNQVLTASSYVPGSPSSITFYATATVGPAAQLAIVTQPSATATAGETFAQQPVVRIEDAFGNPITDDNTTVVSVAINTGTGTLNGILTATATNGIATFIDLSYNVAEVIDLVFSASGLTSVVSEPITVSPSTVAGLEFTTQPGNAYTNEDLDPQPVVQSVDLYGNVTTNGLPESLLVSVALTSGSGELVGTTTLDIGTAASVGVAAFTNLQVTTAGIEKQLTATATNLTDAVSEDFIIGGVEPGISAIIPADGSSVPMTGPAYYELVSGDAGVGTIVLDAPEGFEFDTNSTPAVRIERIGGSGNPENNINQVSPGQPHSLVPVTSLTPTQMTFTVTSSSTNGVINSLTWEGILVKYATGAVPPSGEITKSGTSVMTTVVDGVTSFATLNGEPRPTYVFIVTQPSSTATAGVPFAQQPVVRVEDQYGNIWTNGSFTITAVRAAGSGDLQGTVSVQTVDGFATFTDLSHNVAGSITISFTGENLAPATSGNIVVSPAAADHLHFTTQPGNGVAGAPLSVQPVVGSFDQFGNPSTVGLGASHVVTLALNSGTGSLIGTATADIGTAAGNGVATFTTLGVSTAGDKTLIATAPNLTSEVSATFTVTSDGGSEKLDQTITFAPLADKVFGDAPFTVSATASSGLPVTFSIVDGPATIVGNTITLTGVGTVTVRASQGGNEVYNPAPSVDRSFEVTPSGKLVKGDINGDDETDILFQDGQVIGIWYMNDTNFLSAALLRDGVRGTANWRIFGQADFTGDGKQDIAFQSLDGRLAVWEMNGSVRVSSQLLGGGTALGEGWRAIAVADMDNDQSQDIVMQNVDGSISILFMNGLNFDSTVAVRGTEAFGWRLRAAGDLDGDTVADIIVQNTDGRLAMWKGADYATVVELHGGAAVASKLVGFGDFNGDEQLDLLFRTPANRMSVWLMDGVTRTSATFLRDGRTVDSKWKVVGPR